MKRFLAVLTVLALCLTPALADEALSILPQVKDYADAAFADVPDDAWFAPYAKVCYQTGLMTGTDKGFEPELTLSGGQLIVIAARLREAVAGDVIPRGTPLPGETLAWYHWETEYLKAAGISLPEAEKPATRLQFARLLAAVVGEDHLPAINAVSSLPDTKDPQVLLLYNAGVLTGNDDYGSFDPGGTLRRHECAAMVARIVQPQLRRQFTLQPKPSQTAPTLSYEEELMQTEAVRVNGQSIPFSTVIDTLNALILRTDVQQMANGGSRLDWDAQYQGVDDLGSYFLEQALEEVVKSHLIASRAAALGCAPGELAQKLTPDPSADLDHIYCAKHILVADQAAANSILAQIMANPSYDTFDRLMAQYGTDPGMKSNPNGYLFTDGEMVPEFENAVKSLNIGACSSVPVKSSFGYHIILRLDPTAYPDWAATWQRSRYETLLDEWFAASTVTLNSIELNKLDVRDRYEKYLAEMGL